MQIGAALPANNINLFQAKGCPSRTISAKAQTIKRLSSSSSTDMTKKHISNLEKILQKQESQSSNTVDSNPVFQESNNRLSEKRGRNLLEGLNLANIWPETNAAEQMSPRHLNKLKRLLSSNPMEYSPRNSFGSRWREYHGSNNWLGLLDPLDENLRRELVKYGEFIQAAYHCFFHSNPATSAEEAGPSERHVELPDRSYKVTKSLYATSSIGLPKWVDDVAPDLGWMTQRSSWIGYVAVCDDKTEIQRMGRRDIVIALRGTATCLEWAENFRDLLVPQDDSAKVQCGFLSLYKTGGDHVPSLAESVVNEVQRLIEKYKGETLSITVTGHSLGAALALLVADEVSTCSPNAPPVAVFSFGGPRVGNRGFADRINANNVKVLRIVNNQDLITRVPGMFVSETLDKKLRETGACRVLEMLDYKMPWAYSHVGTEFRVDTRMSPFLKPNADVACCHDLEAYLHLVDGFLASDCPFRPNAKRSLVKLLHEQKSNIRRLHISKAKDLSINLDRGHNFSRSSCLPSPSS